MYGCTLEGAGYRGTLEKGGRESERKRERVEFDPRMKVQRVRERENERGGDRGGYEGTPLAAFHNRSDTSLHYKLHTLLGR